MRFNVMVVVVAFVFFAFATHFGNVWCCCCRHFLLTGQHRQLHVCVNYHIVFGTFSTKQPTNIPHTRDRMLYNHGMAWLSKLTPIDAINAVIFICIYIMQIKNLQTLIGDCRRAEGTWTSYGIWNESKRAKHETREKDRERCNGVTFWFGILGTVLSTTNLCVACSVWKHH